MTISIISRARYSTINRLCSTLNVGHREMVCHCCRRGAWRYVEDAVCTLFPKVHIVIPPVPSITTIDWREDSDIDTIVPKVKCHTLVTRAAITRSVYANCASASGITGCTSDIENPHSLWPFFRHSAIQIVHRKGQTC